MTPGPSLALLHLVRHANPDSAFADFRTAYLAHDPGIAHELVLLLKGFAPAQAVDFMAQADMKARHIVLPDSGQDLLAYARAAARLGHDYFCCTNSYARPDVAGWLGFLARAACLPGVGIAGASGAWESARDATAQALAGRPWWQRLPRQALVHACFPAFPNPAVRTNGFVMRRHDVARLIPRWIRGKFLHAMVESGRLGITRRLAGEGLRAVVVDRAGTPHAVAAWAASGTWRSHGHRGLMLRDNRSDAWEAAAPAEQVRLARLAWGQAAEF